MRSAQADAKRVNRPCKVRGNKPVRVCNDFFADSIAVYSVHCDKGFRSQSGNKAKILARTGESLNQSGQKWVFKAEQTNHELH